MVLSCMYHNHWRCSGILNVKCERISFEHYLPVLKDALNTSEVLVRETLLLFTFQQHPHAPYKSLEVKVEAFNYMCSRSLQADQ